MKNAAVHAEVRSELEQLKKKLGIMSIELEVYREIGGLAVKGANRSSLVARLLDFALKALEAGSVALYEIDAAGRPRFEAARGPSAKAAGALSGLKAASIVARTGRPYLYSGAAPAASAAGARRRQPGRILAAPLSGKQRVTGVIEVRGPKGGRAFAEEDVAALTSLANHFSIIMERAELFGALDYRIKQFSTLNEVGGLLVSSLDQAVVRHRAMEAITRLMYAETGSLLLVDKEKRELYFEVALGEKGKRLKEVRLSIGEGIAGWVAEHGEPVIIPDVDRDPRFQKSVDRKSKFRTRNMVCVPVIIRGEVIGVLQAINRVGGAFTAEDLKLFQLFSNQAAIALDNARLYQEAKETFYATSGALAEAIEKRDPYTGGHTKRVLAYCMAIAGHLKLKPEELEVLRLSAVLHDIGKIGIEDRILKKAAPLSAEEAACMRMHPQYGAEILGHVPQLKDIVPGMLYHHERMDGLGYPSGFCREDIPIVARIIAVADTYDAMTTTRPYRKGLPAAEALRELRRCSGRQFDPRVVQAFARAFRNGEIGGTKAAGREALAKTAGARRHDLV